MTNQPHKRQSSSRPSVSGSYHASSVTPRNAPAHNPKPRHAVETGGSRKQRLIAYAAIFSIVVVAFGFGVGSVVSEGFPKHPDPAMLASAAEQAESQQDGMSEQGESGEEDSAEEGYETYPDPETLAWRDTDFEVNPDRKDWSTEGNGRKTIYLTIDDGPSENTQAVLDILDRYGCKATFFVVGHNDDYFPMIAEAYKRGHTIGLHSMTHDYAQVYSSVDAYFADLDAIGQVVKEQIGYVPCFIRFPGGSSNMISADYTEGIMTTLSSEVQERGYQYYDWNVSSGDGADHTADELVSYSCEPIDAENIVFLCHDSATKQTTVEALPRIIEHYQALGYSFEALDRSSWVCHHGVNN